mmetsp:Transcript_22445/g.75794  ORF Transcript_22445/g.75794 Transcript_22445/m.75794 type:complete len:218 (+) Transcript_22445:144-797(+)
MEYDHATLSPNPRPNPGAPHSVQLGERTYKLEQLALRFWPREGELLHARRNLAQRRERHLERVLDVLLPGVVARPQRQGRHLPALPLGAFLIVKWGWVRLASKRVGGGAAAALLVAKRVGALLRRCPCARSAEERVHRRESLGAGLAWRQVGAGRPRVGGESPLRSGAPQHGIQKPIDGRRRCLRLLALPAAPDPGQQGLRVSLLRSARSGSQHELR